jgi:hypothetical protein
MERSETSRRVYEDAEMAGERRTEGRRTSIGVDLSGQRIVSSSSQH